VVARRKPLVQTRDVTGGTRRPIAIVRAVPTIPLAREKNAIALERGAGADRSGRPSSSTNPGRWRAASAAGDLTRDEVLDNITLYWLTNTGVSASRLYWEYRGGFFNAKACPSRWP
jgi:hypothetical protein